MLLIACFVIYGKQSKKIVNNLLSDHRITCVLAIPSISIAVLGRPSSVAAVIIDLDFLNDKFSLIFFQFCSSFKIANKNAKNSSP